MQNIHIGSSYDDFLEEGIYGECSRRSTEASNCLGAAHSNVLYYLRLIRSGVLPDLFLSFSLGVILPLFPVEYTISELKMENTLAAILTILALSYCIVYLSGEFKLRHQTPQMVLIVAAALPVALLVLLAIGGLIG